MTAVILSQIDIGHNSVNVPDATLARIKNRYAPLTRFKVKESRETIGLVASLVKEFVMFYQLNLREFLYLYTINEKLPKDLVEWVDLYKPTRRVPIRQNRSIISFEVFSETAQDNLRQQPIFTFLPNDVHSKLEINFESPSKFVMNNFAIIPSFERKRNSKTARVFFKNLIQICDYSKGETLVGGIRDRLKRGEGINASYKHQIKTLIHEHFQRIAEGGLFDTIVREHFCLQTLDQLKLSLESKRKAFSHIYRVVIEVEKVLHFRSNNLKAENYLEKMEDLVDFSKRFLIIRATELILDLNSRMNSYLLQYLLVTPMSLLSTESEGRLSKRAFISHEERVLPLLIDLLKVKTKAYEIAQELVADQSSLSVFRLSNDFEREKYTILQTVLELAKTGFHLRLSPLVQTDPIIRVSLQEIAVHRTKETQTTRDFRLDERKYFRSFLYQTADIDEKVIEERLLSFVEKAHQGESKYQKLDEETIEDLFNNKRLFGWLNIDRFLLKPDQSFRSSFKTFIPLIFEHMVSLENLDLTLLAGYSLKTLGQKLNSKLLIPETSILETFNLARLAFKHSVLGVVSLLFVLEHYSYLFTQDLSIVKDLLVCNTNSLQEVEDLETTLLDEIEALKTDHRHISLFIPDEYSAGVIRISLKSFKKASLQKIADTFAVLRRALLAEMKSYLSKISKNIEEINRTCSKVPENVDEYIKLKKKLISKSFLTLIQQTQNLSDGFDIFEAGLEKIAEEYDFTVLAMKLQMNSRIQTCLDNRKSFHDKFKSSRFNFYNEITLHRVELTKEFEEL